MRGEKRRSRRGLLPTRRPSGTPADERDEEAREDTVRARPHVVARTRTYRFPKPGREYLKGVGEQRAPQEKRKHVPETINEKNSSRVRRKSCRFHLRAPSRVFRKRRLCLKNSARTTILGVARPGGHEGSPYTCAIVENKDLPSQKNCFFEAVGDDNEAEAAP